MAISREVVQVGLVPGIAEVLAAAVQASSQVRAARINAGLRRQEMASKERQAKLKSLSPESLSFNESRALSKDAGDIREALAVSEAPPEVPQIGAEAQAFTKDDKTGVIKSLIPELAPEDMQVGMAQEWLNEDGVVTDEMKLGMFLQGKRTMGSAGDDAERMFAQQESARIQEAIPFIGQEAAISAMQSAEAFVRSRPDDETVAAIEAQRNNLEIRASELEPNDPDRINIEQQLAAIDQRLGDEVRNMEAGAQTLEDMPVDMTIAGIGKNIAGLINQGIGEKDKQVTAEYADLLGKVWQDKFGQMTYGELQDVAAHIAPALQAGFSYGQALAAYSDQKDEQLQAEAIPPQPTLDPVTGQLMMPQKTRLFPRLDKAMHDALTEAFPSATGKPLERGTIVLRNPERYHPNAQEFANVLYAGLAPLGADQRDVLKAVAGGSEGVTDLVEMIRDKHGDPTGDLVDTVLATVAVYDPQKAASVPLTASSPDTKLGFADRAEGERKARLEARGLRTSIPEQYRKNLPSWAALPE